MNKLNVGDYVRTKDGVIDKVVIEYNGKCASPYCTAKHVSCVRDYYDEEDIIKSSPNIIDLIEVGDYVNGYKIKEVNNNLNKHEGICNSLDTELWFVNDNNKFEEMVLFENDIKSIVTHEQFLQMEYKVGGIDE